MDHNLDRSFLIDNRSEEELHVVLSIYEIYISMIIVCPSP